MTERASSSQQAKRDQWEFAIAIFKLIKAALLIALAIGIFSVLHKDAAEVLEYRVWQLGVDPQNYRFQKILRAVDSADTKDLALASIGTFFYAALFATEGIGLLLHRGWAEYFTVFETGSFIPYEIFELTRHFTVFKMIVILLNIATVVYLVLRIKARRRQANAV